MNAVELAGLVEARLAAIEATHPWRDYSASNWRARDAATRRLLDELERDHGARYRGRPPDNHHFSLAGISNSCTAGALPMLRAWAKKARRLNA